ncbi:YCII-related [Flavobacteriaceae bacterium]
MQKAILTLLLITNCNVLFSQEIKSTYDEKLAKSLNADEYGMKQYVFCILKTGSNTTASPEERSNLFKGHMTNINRLAQEGKLVVAGPFMKNERNYRGIYIFNVSTIEDAKTLVNSDPAVKENIFETEMTIWYGSAALQETLQIHEKIAKTKI